MEGRLSRDVSPPRKAQLQRSTSSRTSAMPFSDDWSVGVGPVIGFSYVDGEGRRPFLQQTPAGPTFGQLGIPRRTEFARASLEGRRQRVRREPRRARQDQHELGGRGAIPLERRSSTTMPTPPSSRFRPACSRREQPVRCARRYTVDALPPPLRLRRRARRAEGQDSHHAPRAGAVRPRLQRNPEHDDQRRLCLGRLEGVQGAAGRFPGDATDRVLLENYNNTSALRLGVEHRYTGVPRSAPASPRRRSRAAPDVTVTPLLPEQDRAYGSTAAVSTSTKSPAVDAAYSASSRPAAAAASTSAPRSSTDR